MALHSDVSAIDEASAFKLDTILIAFIPAFNAPESICCYRSASFN